MDVVTNDAFGDVVTDQKPQEEKPKTLKQMSRAELETRAEAAGIEGPFDRFSNREELIAAVEAAENGTQD